MSEMPEIDYRAGAIVTQLGGSVDPAWVVESPAEIRAKLKALKEAHSMGIDSEDDEMLLVLTGLDLYTDKPPHVEPYDLSLHPGTVLQIKEVNERFWDSHLARAREEKPGPPEGMPPAMAEALTGLGVDLSQVTPLFPPGVSPHGGEGDSATMTLEQFNENGAEVECCCGHKALNHVISERRVEECTECDCVLFHTHTAPAA
jgi:hypothetical protein